MPRRNNRSDYQPPEDLTPPAVIPRGHGNRGYGPDTYLLRVEMERAAAERQRKARMRDGIDWSMCIVPGCGLDYDWLRKLFPPERRNPELRLPLCSQHMMAVFHQVKNLRNDPVILEANEEIRRRDEADDAEAFAADKAEFMRRTDGDIYFVKQNGLVKVGWSRNLINRLRDYGPSAEILCHFPGTYDDETNLHRQLRPALALGREWYEDGPVIALFLEKALAKYGPPTAKPIWTEHKPIVGSRNHR